jgi:hypothetical protein
MTSFFFGFQLVTEVKIDFYKGFVNFKIMIISGCQEGNQAIFCGISYTGRKICPI